jgi:hypothetical protein
MKRSIKRVRRQGFPDLVLLPFHHRRRLVLGHVGEVVREIINRLAAYDCAEKGLDRNAGALKANALLKILGSAANTLCRALGIVIAWIHIFPIIRRFVFQSQLFQAMSATRWVFFPEPQ